MGSGLNVADAAAYEAPKGGMWRLYSGPGFWAGRARATLKCCAESHGS